MKKIEGREREEEKKNVENGENIILLVVQQIGINSVDELLRKGNYGKKDKRKGMRKRR